MFIKLKVTYKGNTFFISIHEAVYIAQTVLESLVPEAVPLILGNPPVFPEPDEAIKIEDDFPKALAQVIVPFAIGPLKNPLQWLFVANNIPSLKPRRHVGISINHHLVGVQLENLYSADFGLIPMIAQRLYFSTCAEEWRHDGFMRAHDALYEIIQNEYQSGNLLKLVKRFDEGLVKDSRESLKKFYPWMTAEDLDKAQEDIRNTHVLEDFLPQFFENRRIYNQNRSAFFTPLQGKDSSNGDKVGFSLEQMRQGYRIIRDRVKKANEGDFELLPKAEYAYRSSLDIYDSTNPHYDDLQKVEADIAKGPSYQKIDRTQEAKLHYISDVEIAKIARSILNGERVDNAPNYLPNLLACWFVCEPSRNNASLLSSAILLDFLEHGVSYFPIEYETKLNIYNFQYFLRNPHVGQRGVKIVDIYGKSLGPDEWGGMHPMACAGSYEDGKNIQIVKNKGKWRSQHLTLVKQKEGSLILHWLFNALQFYCPEAIVELEENNPDQPLERVCDYNEVVVDSDNTSNPKLPCNLKIEPTNVVALNQAIRQAKDEINRIKRKEIPNQEAEIKIELDKLEPLKAKQMFIEEIMKPLLKKRLSSFQDLYHLDDQLDIAVRKKDQHMRWYTEDIIIALLTRELGENAVIMPQTQLEHASLLNDNLSNAIANALEERKPVVIPIHLHGNHWASMALKKTEDGGPLQVIYNDPLGNPLEYEIRAVEIVCIITQFDPDANIIDLQLPQQSNDMDCGPFIVDNLVRIATHSTQDQSPAELRQLLAQPLSGSARVIRQQHHQLLLQVHSEAEIDHLFDDNHSTLRPSDHSQSVPRYDLQLCRALWELYPDKDFMDDCLARFYFFEQSLKTGKVRACIDLAVNLLMAYIEGYSREPDSSVDQIQKLEEQVNIIRQGRDFHWVDAATRAIFIGHFASMQMVKAAEAYKDLQINLQDAWVLKLLAIISRDPKKGHEKLMCDEIFKKMNLNVSLSFLAGDDRWMAITESVDEFIEWINVQLNNGGGELIALFQKLLMLMDKFNMQSSLLYSACSNQIKLLQRGSNFQVKIALDFIADLKHLELIFNIKHFIDQAIMHSKSNPSQEDDCEEQDSSYSP